MAPKAAEFALDEIGMHRIRRCLQQGLSPLAVPDMFLQSRKARFHLRAGAAEGSGLLGEYLVAEQVEPVPGDTWHKAATINSTSYNTQGFSAHHYAKRSAVLACLLALALPPYAPWPIVVLGTGVAVLLGKHAFGGLGHNIFNPAMVGYVFVLLCFPFALSVWPQAAQLTDYPGPLDSLVAVLWQTPVLR